MVVNDPEHLILNLNAITFKKGKLSFGYAGYAFRVTIFDNDGKVYKELMINSNETIRYNGFFYTDELGRIDFGYIENLFKDNE